MKDNKNMMAVWVLIVLVIIAGLVWVTIKGYKNASPANQVGQVQNNNMGNTQQPSVKITILKEGTGAVAKTGDTVAMKYTGMLANGEIFDSNVDKSFNHAEPFTFTIGAGQVIPGWDQGIVGMKVGEQRKLEIPPELAYGATGAGGVIPPNATLTFTVELLEIK